MMESKGAFKGFSPSAFYKPPDDKVREKLAKLDAVAENISGRKSADALSTCRSSILSSHSKTHEVFHSQKEAIDFAVSTRDASLRIFAFEVDGSGRRQFSVCHPETLWTFYQHLARRHYYEVIAENCACNLYFDLEFRKNLNPDVDGSKLLRDFEERLVEDLKDTFGDAVPANPEVLGLVSSTEEKFSWHLIVTNVHFADNYQAGNYVKGLCRKLLGDGSVGKVVLKVDGTEGLFVDEGVYTKNRNFRIYGSSKFGKTAVLGRAGDTGAPSKAVFLSSLITVVPEGGKPLVFEAEVAGAPGVATALRATRSERCSEPSPFPEIDDFIGSLVKEEGSVGYVRRWALSSNGAFLTYDIAGGYKYCHNVGRHHKSNNIKFVVDINNSHYFQACGATVLLYFM